MARLFEPLLIGDLRLDNRIVIAPMCQYSASNGTAGDWHMIHLGHLALSGAGLIGTTVGSTMRMRKYWRRAISRSWILSKWYYRLHGLQLTGRASDTVWYFAYGSNMHDGAFLEQRLMRPTEWRVGRLKGYRLRFNLDGVPKGKTAPANVCPDPDSEVWVCFTRSRTDKCFG